MTNILHEITSDLHTIKQKSITMLVYIIHRKFRQINKTVNKISSFTDGLCSLHHPRALDAGQSHRELYNFRHNI